MSRASHICSPEQPLLDSVHLQEVLDCVKTTQIDYNQLQKCRFHDEH